MIEKRTFIRITCDKCGAKYDAKGGDIILAKGCAGIYGWKFVTANKGLFLKKEIAYCPKCASGEV